MKACLAQALLARPLSPPNPAVGAVLVGKDGTLIGVGHTQHTGGPHAEIMALRHAQTQGHDVRGATLYVSLEPCSHQGRTGPCTQALISASIKKVVASTVDPNPLVSGQGFAQLRAAGIDLEVGPGMTESRELNIGFFSRMIRTKPWVRLKVATSLDGKTALENGNSQWITSEPARIDGHHWRARACAILTGIGTVLDDNPKLDVRLATTLRQPKLIVVDSRLETPLDAQIFMAERQVFIYAAVENPEKKAALESRGVTVIYMPSQPQEKELKVDLASMLHDLACREINELHVEAGHKLNGSLIRDGLVDEFLIYLAPKLIGLGLPMASFGPLNELSNAIPLEFRSAEFIASDLRVIARVAGHDQF